jgi:nitroimidazol reductase NimA-like FMN-containing flavoprotein (pyridoxamine 5'-phosphate oxidase superfamily)
VRRTDREITDSGEIFDIIRNCHTMRLGLCREGVPYVVPLNYGYEDGSIYFHCAPAGLKLDFIRENSLVCFEIDTDVELVRAEEPSGFRMKYRSVIGWGHAFLVEDEAAKVDALDILMRQHRGPEGPYSENALRRVMLVRIDIDKVTGKHGSAESCLPEDWTRL